MKHTLLCLTLALLFTSASAALAQTTGVLSGKVVDENGKPVVGAVIRIVGTPRGGLTEAPDGAFTIAGVRAGDYTVEFSGVGYSKVERSVHISVNQTTNLGTVELPTKSIQGKEVVVRAGRTIQPEQVGTVREISRDELDRSTRNDIVGVVALENSVNTNGVNGFSIRGGRATETSIKVDGVEVSDPFVGGFGNTAASLYPQVSQLGVQTVQVSSSGISAEYGDVLTGVVNSVTRAGRNDRYEGELRYRTRVPALYGSSSAITVKKVGTDQDTTLPAYTLLGSATQNLDFGFGGPFPGFNKLTFFFAGALEYHPRDGGYDVLDMDPAYAAARTQIAQRVWGFALTPLNLGELQDQQYMVRDINGKLHFNVTDDIYLEATGEIGLTSRELGGWGGAYLFDKPVFFAQDANGNPIYTDTLSPDEMTAEQRARLNVLERDAQQTNQNTIVDRASLKYFQALSQADFFEVNGSWVKNRYEVGKKDETKSYGIFDTYDIYPIVDANGDQIIDIYEAPTARAPLNEFTDPSREPTLQMRNPITGFFEGDQTAGAGMNPYGLVDGTFIIHGNSRNLDIRESETYALSGTYETNFAIGDIATQLKAGGDFNYYTLRRNYNSLPWNPKPFFDVYGFPDIPYFGDDSAGQALAQYLIDPYHPMKGALWVQTRFQYKSINFEPGVRFDFVDPNALEAPAVRQRPIDVVNGLAAASDAALKFQVSPRVGVTYPVTDRSQFRVNFAMMFKMPEFNLLFDNAYGDAQRGSQIFGDPNIDPEKVFSYEMGYEAQIADVYFLDVSAFYRDIFNQSGVTYVPAVPSSYTVYTVQDYGNVRGLEITLERELSDNFTAQLNYTLQRAVGTSSNPTSNYLPGTDPYTGEKRTVPLTEFPLSYDQTHKLNLTAAVVWGQDEGPTLGGVHLLENTDAQFTFTFGTGLPYTRFNTKGQQVGEYNGDRYPSTFGTELHLERGFRLSDLMGESVGNLEISVFADVYNLLNITGPVSYYTTTGSPDQNGTNLDRKVGDFIPTAWYAEIDPARPETFAASQYDRFGTRWYNPYADVNLDGVETQQEKYESYQRFVATYQSQRRNYATPRTVSVGFKVKF